MEWRHLTDTMTRPRATVSLRSIIQLMLLLLLCVAHQAVSALDDGGGNEECHDPSRCQRQCGIYLALSTLPGTGIGMFAGRNFQATERLMMAGDLAIPNVDLSEASLWDSYTWVRSVVVWWIRFVF